ncbi:MAG: hypothetical protein D3908_05585 [Candidatus Electrothrix sp. AUS4]|nr:hypothetical protein [Candidatus Electrothrix sp. AUS4]
MILKRMKNEGDMNVRIIFIMFLLLPCSVVADTIELNSGQKLTGKILEKNDELIKIDTGNGTVIYDRDEIRSIYQEDPGMENGSLSINFSDGQSELVMPPASSDPDKWENAIERYLNIKIPETKEYENKPLEVKRGPDVAILLKFGMDLGLGLMFSCMAEVSRELQAKGNTADQLISIMTDKEEAIQIACLCEYKEALLEEYKKELDPVLLKHPEWRRKELVIKEGGMVEKISIPELERTKNLLLQCDN